MKNFKELLEARGDTAVFTFGRFNPPTIGHEKLLKAANKAATGGTLKIYPSRTQDPKKNPLDPSTKISFMRKMFPDYAEQIINDPDMKSIFDVLVNADKDGYGNVNIVVGSDRVTEFDTLVNKYNKKEYTYNSIKTVSAGDRDPDADDVSGMSASKLRAAVSVGDYALFSKGTPKTLTSKEKKAMYDIIRKVLPIQENFFEENEEYEKCTNLQKLKHMLFLDTDKDDI